MALRRKPRVIPEKVVTVSPTPERLRHAEGDFDIAKGTGAWRVSDVTLHRLYVRDQLDPHNKDRNKLYYDAGDALYHTWHKAGLSGYTGIDMDFVSGGDGDKSYMMPTTVASAICRGKLRVAQEAVGPHCWPILIAICVTGETAEEAGRRCTNYRAPMTARAVALDRLRNGLHRLAEEWGHLSSSSRPARILAFTERPHGTALMGGGDE